jgi:hypothetical protein
MEDNAILVTRSVSVAPLLGDLMKDPIDPKVEEELYEAN